MRPHDLNSFIDRLAGLDDLARIKCPVDPVLEIAAIVNRVCKTGVGGKALLFENVRGSGLRIAANLFGSCRRMAACFGVDDLGVLGEKIRDDLAAGKGRASGEVLAQLAGLPESAAVTVPDAPWQERDMTDDGLNIIPALQSWPGDGGRYLTLGQVFTRHPLTGATNCGLYRVQLQGRHRALLRCHPGSGGAAHLKAWHDRGEAMPVAIALGGPPALTCAASLSLPENVPEVNFIGYLTGSAVAMSPGMTSQLPVPATAEIVIEGRIFPGEVMPEGPFGNHTGYYAPKSPAPVIRVESLRMKQDAVYPCTVVGPPPMENIYLARTAETLLLPLLQHDCPWVRNVVMPVESIFHRVALVSVADGAVPNLEDMQDALQSSMLLKGSKLIVLVDEQAAGLGQQELYWQVLNSMIRAKRTGDVVVDARDKPGAKKIEQTELILQTIERRWQEYGL